MGQALSQSKLRATLEKLDTKLFTTMQYLWQVANDIHKRQDRPGSNENGAEHVAMVEHNIWRLLHNTLDRSTGQRLIEILEPEPYEIFILSGAACCHDFDKAYDLPDDYIHGESSGKIVIENADRLGLNEHQADEISRAIAIHDQKSDEFPQSLSRLNRRECCPKGVFNLHRVALLLKTADILHCDASRIPKIGIDQDAFAGLNKLKYLTRECTKGWDLDGRRVLIQANPNTLEKITAFQKGFSFMKENEWKAVTEALESYNIAHELALHPDTENLIIGFSTKDKKNGLKDDRKSNHDLCSHCFGRVQELSRNPDLGKFLKAAVDGDFLEAVKTRGALQVMREISDALEKDVEITNKEILKHLLAALAPLEVPCLEVIKAREVLQIDPANRKGYQCGILQVSLDMEEGADAIFRAALFDLPCTWKPESQDGKTWPQGEHTLDIYDVPSPGTTISARTEALKRHILEECRARRMNMALASMYEWLYNGNPLTILCKEDIHDILKGFPEVTYTRPDGAILGLENLVLFLSLCKESELPLRGVLERLQIIGQQLLK